MSGYPRLALPPKAIAVIAMLISMVSVQAGASFGKHLFPIIGAERATALRQAFAALFLLIVFQPWRGLPDRRDWKLLGVFGFVIGVMNLSFYLGIARVPLGVGVAIEFLGPLTVAVISSRRFSDFFWIACALAGFLILLPWEGTGQALDPIGVAWCLAAAVCWGTYIVVGQKVGGRVHGGKAVAIGMAVSTVFILPIGVVHSGADLWRLDVLPWGMAVAVLSSAIPYSLEMLALKALPARTFSLMTSLSPAIAALVGLAALGEALSRLQWLAVALVVVASAGSSLTAKRVTDEATP